MDLKQLKKTLNENIELVLKKLDVEYEILGDNIYAKCPVHDGSDNPRAFSYSIQRGIWKCWTRDCQHEFNNDIFGFIRGTLSRKEGIDVGFKEALKWANSMLGIKSRAKSKTKVTVPEVEEDDFHKLVHFLNNDIEEKIHDNIDIECNLQYPSKYFLGRGFKAETLLHFEVGDCANSKSKMYDRAVIPIHDDSGSKVIAMIGRSIKEYKIPKFLFSEGFNKKYFFYNYHRAIDQVNLTGTLFVVEGQGDVWKLYEAGILNAMSIFGKTITKEQEDKLAKMPLTHLIVLTDNDQAGRESKVQIQRQLGRMYKLTFPKIPTKDIGEMTVDQIKNKVLPQIKGSY